MMLADVPMLNRHQAVSKLYAAYYATTEHGIHKLSDVHIALKPMLEKGRQVGKHFFSIGRFAPFTNKD